MYHRLGNLVARHWLAVLLAWVAILITLRLVAPSWDDVARDGDLAFLPADMPSIQGDALLNEAFPQARASSQIVLVFARATAPLQPEDYQFIDEVAEVFRRHQTEETLPLRDVWTVDTKVVGRMLQSKDNRSALISLQLNTEFMATANIDVLETVEQELAAAKKNIPPGLELGITGSAAIGGDMLDSAKESITSTEQTTVFLVVIILLLVYRAPLLVLIPLTTIFFSIQVALPIVAILTQLGTLPGMDWWHFQVFKTTKIFVVVILYGAGTDYCLFLIARYKEELAAGRDSSSAVAPALGNVGSALVASGLTTVLGLGTMFFADFGKYTNSGPAIAICLTVALAACMTLAPALLAALGRGVFWPFGSAAIASHAVNHEEDHSEGHTANGPHAKLPRLRMDRFWDWLATRILARPGWILVIAIVIMAPIAYQGLSVNVTYDLLSELNEDRPSVRGTALLREHFPPGETGPVTVLVYRESGGFDTKDGEVEIALLTKLLYDLPDDGGRRIAASVRSVTEPLGDVPGYVQPFTSAGLLKMAAKAHPLTKERFVTQVPELAGKVARLDVTLRSDPFSEEAIELVNLLQNQLQQLSADKQGIWAGDQFLITGTTAGIRDLKNVTEGDQRRIQRLVVLAVLMVLLLILRHPVICLYLIFSVLWSYFVTIGLTEAVFEWMYGTTYLGLDWKVPIFLFVILIAVGEDYNIYLVTRVWEEQAVHGARRGLHRGLVSTGGIITSCGLIMAGTFVSMMTGSLRGMIELGFALSLGVLLDTFVVRTVLVPAFLALLIREPATKNDETQEKKHAENKPESHGDEISHTGTSAT